MCHDIYLPTMCQSLFNIEEVFQCAWQFLFASILFKQGDFCYFTPCRTEILNFWSSINNLGWKNMEKDLTLSFIIWWLQEEDLLGIFNKQIEDDKRIVISRSNLSEMHRVRYIHNFVFGGHACIIYLFCLHSASIFFLNFIFQSHIVLVCDDAEEWM